MRDSFYKCFGVSSTEPGATLEIRMAEFYEAEKSAFNPKAVRDSFAMVGLHPWDIKLILKNCRENSPVDPESDESSIIDDLAKKICMYSDKKRDEMVFNTLMRYDQLLEMQGRIQWNPPVEIGVLDQGD